MCAIIQTILYVSESLLICKAFTVELKDFGYYICLGARREIFFSTLKHSQEMNKNNSGQPKARFPSLYTICMQFTSRKIVR